MVQVKELIPLLKTASEVIIVWGDSTRKIDIRDTFGVDAYGEYMCDTVAAPTKDYFELHIAFRPIKATEE